MIGRQGESGLFPPLMPAQIEDAMEICDEYRQREIEEGITPHDLSADDADWDGYAQQWRKRA